MSFLLDTHILLWFLENDSKLSNQVREVITNPENLIFVSAISAWEISLFLDHPALLALAPLTQTDSPQGLLSQPTKAQMWWAVPTLRVCRNLVSYKP